MSLNVDHISGGWQLFISGSTIKSMLSNNANSKTFYFYYFPFLLCVCVCPHLSWEEEGFLILFLLSDPPSLHL